jgi:EpsI family protein
MTGSTPRLLALAGCFAIATAGLGRAMEPEQVPLRRAFALMPPIAGHWTGKPAPELTRHVLTLLGVTDYVDRIYTSASAEVVSLYVGYYESQRAGNAIHSPMNCLPGSGWQPLSTTYVELALPGRTEPVTVKRVLIEKGLDRQVVLYWYQSHGRLIGNEYWSKALMVYDAARLNRSDAALVRIVTPVRPGEGEAVADRVALDFVHTIFPQLEAHLPS